LVEKSIGAANSIVEPAQTSAPTGLVNLATLAPLIVQYLDCLHQQKKHHQISKGRYCRFKVIGKLGFAITIVCVVVVFYSTTQGYDFTS
jgi:hypothetical protein